MSKAPSMPMFWDAYIADTTHLTCEEHGAYLLLLAAMWRRDGAVPNNDKDIARILSLTLSKWRKIKLRLSPLLITTNDEISQENLTKIWKKTQEKIAKNVANGAKGGRAVSNKNKDLTQANASNSLKPDRSIPEPEPYIKDIPKEGISKKSVCFDEFWKLYPNKVGKGAAKVAFSKALKKVDFREITDGLIAYIRKTDDRPWCNPSTWLNQDRWEDQPAQVPKLQDNSKRTTASVLNDLAKSMEGKANGHASDYKTIGGDALRLPRPHAVARRDG